MGLWGVGFLCGVVMCLIFVGVGVCFDDFSKRDNNRICGTDSSGNNVLFVGVSGRRCDNRPVISLKEREIIVLQNMRRVACREEREIIDTLIDEIQEKQCNELGENPWQE